VEGHDQKFFSSALRRIGAPPPTFALDRCLPLSNSFRCHWIYKRGTINNRAINKKTNKTRVCVCVCVCVTVFSTTSKNHQRALDAMQINLETESRNKVEAMRVKKKLEQDINDLEMTLDGVNKAKAETERNFKKYQQQIRDLQQVHYVTLRYVTLRCSTGCTRNSGQCDNDSLKYHKYLCIGTNQPDTKSNPNLNYPTARDSKSILQNIVTCPTYPEKFIRDNVIAPFSQPWL